MFAGINVETWKVILQIASVLVALVATGWTISWAVRAPKLRISLLDSRGYRTTFGDSPDAPPAFFYHLRVSNRRKWTANNVRVKVANLTKEGKDGGNWQQRVPVYLIWAAHPSPKPYLLDVLGRDEEACNVGYIVKKNDEETRFQLDAMDPARFAQNFKWPPNFQGFLNRGEAMQVEVVALAENAKSNALRLKISWDGQWHDNAEEMQNHLRVTTIHPTTLASVRNFA
jgi:hypothetical protein